ncbi:hypothetical protein X975_13876, partial [Stegodyphus mimosarum]
MLPRFLLHPLLSVVIQQLHPSFARNLYVLALSMNYLQSIKSLNNLKHLLLYYFWYSPCIPPEVPMYRWFLTRFWYV